MSDPRIDDYVKRRPGRSHDRDNQHYLPSSSGRPRAEKGRQTSDTRRTRKPHPPPSTLSMNEHGDDPGSPDDGWWGGPPVLDTTPKTTKVRNGSKATFTTLKHGGSRNYDPEPRTAADELDVTDTTESVSCTPCDTSHHTNESEDNGATPRRQAAKPSHRQSTRSWKDVPPTKKASVHETIAEHTRSPYHQPSLQPTRLKLEGSSQDLPTSGSHQRNDSTGNGIPTWTGGHLDFMPAFGGGGRRLDRNRDANSTAAPNPRNWGQRDIFPPPPPPSLLSLATPASTTPAAPVNEADETDDSGWDTPAERLKSWVAGVSPVAPPDRTPTPAPEVKLAGVDEDLAPRPDSARRVAAPTTVYYSDESTSSPELEPAVLTTHESNSPGSSGRGTATDADTPLSVQAQLFSNSPPPAIASLPPPPASGPSPPPPPPPACVAVSHRNTHGNYNHHCHPTKWWHKELHPLHNPVFASRRLCIKVPFPIRNESLKSTMYDHFGRYGGIRMVQVINDVLVDQGDTVFVVFHMSARVNSVLMPEDERSVKGVLADPSSIHCLFKSASRTSQVSFDFQITQVASTANIRHVWIKLTGIRPDSRSPSPEDFGSNVGDGASTGVKLDTSRLPDRITVWAVPTAGHKGRVWHRIWTVGPGHDVTPIRERAEKETGQQCQAITVVDFGSRFSEEKILRTLVECFVDVLSVRPPSQQSKDGWVYECTGPRDTDDLMDTLSRVPGMTVRRASADEVAAPRAAPRAASPTASHALSLPASAAPTQASFSALSSQPAISNEPPVSSQPPMASEAHPPYKQRQSNIASVAPSDRVSSKGAKARRANPSTPSRSALNTQPCSKIEQPHPQPNEQTLPEPIVQSFVSESVKTQPSPQCYPSRPRSHAKEPSDSQLSTSTESNYPGLVRRLVLTYRGRQLREEIRDGASRYIDDAAVFVGRLVKTKETSLTLLRRFERYGKIASIEYNPQLAVGQTYASARILFQDNVSAHRAMESENGVMSFGSALRVEPRRVLQHDVQAREMYLDGQGRAISPSMVSQYTVPSPPSLPSLFPDSVSQLAQSGWFNNMGVGAASAMPAMMTTPMMVPTPSVYGEGSDSQPMVMPVMWPMGFGVYPGTVAPSTPQQLVQRATMPAIFIPNPTPPKSFPTPATSGRRASQDKPTGSTAPSILDGTDAKAALATPGASPVVDTTCRATPGVPRVVSARFQDGVFMPIYDPKQLKQWREANGIHEAKVSSPPAPAPAPAEQLSLLPIYTGGHDPSSASTLPPTAKVPADQFFDHTFGRAPGSHFAPQQQPMARPLGEYPRRSFEMDRTSRMVFHDNDEARRLSEAAARQSADHVAREQIRAQLSQTLQDESPIANRRSSLPVTVSPRSSAHKLVPIPVPFAGPSRVCRGSASTDQYTRSQFDTRAPVDPPRKRGPKPRQESLLFSPQNAAPPVRQSRVLKPERNPSQEECGGW